MTRKKSSHHYNKTGLIMVAVVIAVTLISLGIIIADKVDFSSTGQAGFQRPSTSSYDTPNVQKAETTTTFAKVTIEEIDSILVVLNYDEDEVYVSVNYNQFREDTDNEITFNTGIIDTEDEYRLNAIEKVRADSLFDPVDTTYGFYDHFANSYTFTPEGPSVMDSGIVGIYGFNEDDKTIAKINIPLESENSVLESIFEDTTESMGTGSSGLQLSAPVCSTTDDNGPDFDKKGTISCDEFCFDISTEQRVFTCDGENCRLYESWYDDDGVIHSGLIDCLNHGFNFCKDGMCV